MYGTVAVRVPAEPRLPSCMLPALPRYSCGTAVVQLCYSYNFSTAVVQLYTVCRPGVKMTSDTCSRYHA